jgi:MazG family protein
MERLSCLLDGLLDPEGGCPWDLKQTVESISEDFLEEAYELREAILTKSGPGVLEEAGDLLFLVSFLGRLALKGGLGFGITEITDGVVNKMVRRHPHVFGEAAKLGSPEEVLQSWHQTKKREKLEQAEGAGPPGAANAEGAQPPPPGLLDSVPLALPALARNARLCSKAARSGFDWSGPAEVRKKLGEELGELDAEIQKGAFRENRERLSHELGDCLAALSNLARHLGLSPEKALDAHNRRFAERFRFVESELAKGGRAVEDADMSELEALWQRAKGR